MKRGTEVYRLMPVGFLDGKWNYKVDGPLKVMGEIDGYLMVRKKGAGPFCLSKKDAVDARGERLVQPEKKPKSVETSPELMKSLGILLNRNP